MNVDVNDMRDFYQKCRDDPVFFVEHLLINPQGEPYKLEDYQKTILRCPAKQKVYFLARRLSKTTLIQFELLHKTIFNRSFKAMTMSPTWNQALRFGKDLVKLIQRSPHILPLFKKLNPTSLELLNYSTIESVSAGRAGVSQLGGGVSMLVFDESQQIAEETFDFIRPVLRGQVGESFLIYAGTPLSRDGQFFDVYSEGRYYVKWEDFEDGEPVMSIYEGDPDDNFVVFQRQTAYLDDESNIIGSGTKRITVDELEEDRKDMSHLGFGREYCLNWSNALGEVFPQHLIESVTNKEFDMEGDGRTSKKEIVMGLDLGKQRNNSVLTVGELLDGQSLRVIYVKRFETGLKYTEIINEIDRMRVRYPNALKLLIDQTGVGNSVIEDIERILSTWPKLVVEGFVFGLNSKNDLVENGVMALESGNILIPDYKILQDEMLEFKREITPKGNIIYHKPAGGSDDCVDSLLLCLRAAHQYIGNKPSEPVAFTLGKRLLFDKAKRFGGIL